MRLRDVLVRIFIPSLRKSQITNLREFLLTKNKDPMVPWLKMCALIIDSKLYKPPPEKPKQKVPKHKFNMIFSSKAFDFIKLTGILRSQTSICKLPPNSVLENEIPMKVYRLI